MSKLIRKKQFTIKVYQCHSIHPHLTSKLIEFHQKSNYSHMAIGFVSESGREMIIDSTRKNISLYPADKYLKEKYEVKGVAEVVLECSRMEFLDYIEPLLGLDYPEEQIIAILLKIVSFRNGAKKMTCNELVLRILIELKNGFVINEKLLDIMDLNSTWLEVQKVSK